MQPHAGPIIGLVHADLLAAALECEGGPRHPRRDAVVAAREPLAVAAVADARARLRRRVVEGDRVADRGAVAAAREGLGGALCYV